MIPTPKHKPTFKSHVNEGVYEIIYTSPAGDFTGGFKPKGSDILTLEKAGGYALAPRLIFASKYELEQNFSEVRIVISDVPPTADPGNTSKD